MFYSSRRFHSLLIAPFLVPFLLLVNPKNNDNNPPVALDDSIVVHGFKPINASTELLGNDSDPDGDGISFDRVIDYPAHGNLYIPSGFAPQGYTPNSGYTGTDTFTYRVQDGRGAYSNSATVTLDVRNSAPTPGADSVTVHGFTSFGTPNILLANDSDPDGDDISFDRILTYPGHGNLYIPFGSIPQGYTPFASYTGSDSFTYRICDSLGLCADTTVTLDVRNNGPTPGNDSFTIHGFTRFGESDLLANESDPDGDQISFDRILTYPEHGNLYIPSGIPPQGYTPNAGYTGSDSFSYRICDNLGLCGSATVSLDVRNNAPTAGADSFTIHGFTRFGESDLLANDSDSDGDTISFDRILDYPAHGNLYIPSGIPPQGYTPNLGYTGPDSFTYRICDNLGLCATATVSLDVRNSAPTPGDDEFTIRGFTRFSADDLLSNDHDSDSSDTISFDRILDYPAHGNLYIPYGNAPQGYTPNSGFAGTDSFTYRICDNLGKCADGTVTLNVVGNGESDGPCDPCDGAVGSPINVSNGNMYLQQSDYQLPSVGPGLSVTRTYNSNSQRVGLFGRGWSTVFDESILAYDTGTLRFNHAGGRAVYFGRTLNSSAAFKDLVGDLHEQINQGAGFTLTMKDASVEQFNSAGKLLAMSDRNGNTTTLNYDANGFLSSITDPFGRVLTITTNANGQATSISDTMGTIATFTYGGSNELLSVIYADSSAFSFSYDGSLRLTTVTDALGHIVESHTYDGQGRAITSEKQGGVDHYSVSYVSANETDVTDGLSRVTKYTFDTSKGRNVVTQVEGLCSCGGGSGSQIQTWAYDNQLNVTSKTDALGHSFSYTYDTNGNRLTETDSSGTVTYTYNSFAEVLTRTDQLNFVTTNTFDSQGYLLSTTDARGKTTNFVNDSRGLLISVTDARDKITGFTHDANGNLIKRTDALLHDTQFAYDARGRVTSTTNALGFATAFTYDAVGRLTQITQADGTTIGYEYDLAGRRTAITDAKGNRSTFAYDGANRLITQTDALNQSTNSSYDAMSNLTSSTDALGRVTNYDYDDFNRLVKTTYPPATTGATRLYETIEYDAGGNVTKRIDTAGRATQYQYDALNRLTSTIDADNKTTSLEYDALSRRTALVDAIGQRYRFNYNAVGAITHLRHGTDVMSFTYDAVGNRKTRTDYNGAVTDYTYDALNRLKTITYPDTTTVNYAYDKLSRLQTAANENGTVNFDYNKMNRMVRATDVFGQVVEYNFDAKGNRTKLSLNTATVATYRYDAIDRVTKILDAANAAFNFTYDATSKLTSRKAPNGVLATYQYDDLDRLTRITDKKAATTVADFQYQFNNASNISSITDLASTNSFSYDALDRLTSATHSNQANESYALDSVGNRTSSHLSSTYTYQRFNRLVSAASATYSYDANGNLTSKTDSSGTTQYSWDFENRLRQVSLPNGNIVNYKYDALARRIERNANLVSPLPLFTTARFIYDDADVIRDTDGNGVTTADYLNGPGIDNKLRQATATTNLYFVQDHLGSTRSLTDANGNVVANLNYDSFGNGGATPLTRYAYTGREFDSDTGLYYYRARFYDPQIGRFASEDPALFLGGINLYAYVENDPIQFLDPYGLIKGDRWYGYNDSDFHKWFHRCWKQRGDPDASKHDIAAAYSEWVSRGAPKGGNCWGGGKPDPSACREPVPSRERNRGPSMDELRLQEESARQMEQFWTKVLIGDAAIGAVALAPEGAVVTVIRWIWVAGRSVPVLRLVPAH